MAKTTVKFKINRKGIRENILLDSTGVGVEKALIGIAEAVKPPGTEVFVSASYGASGRSVIHIFDRTANDAPSPKTRARQRAIKKQLLQAALNRVGGKFRRGGGTKL